MNAQVVLIFTLLVVAVCSQAAVSIPVEAVQLAFGNDATTEMTVSWHTATMGEQYTPTVLFGTTPGHHDNQVVGGETVTYNTTAGFSHHVFLKGLKPATL